MGRTGRGQAGGVSIFIVIFTALLLTVATTSFVQLMIRDERQASNNDLSQSAYDAAMAGVEDAKRALVALDRCNRNPILLGCTGSTGIIKAFDDHDQDCEFLEHAGVNDFINGEVQVGDPAQNQAYTCVKVDPNSPDERGNLDGDGAGKVIELKAKANFNKVRISWFKEEDLASSGVGTIASRNGVELLSREAWRDTNSGSKIPPILRAQLIQFEKKKIELKRFDASRDTSDAHTAFLYPNTIASQNSVDWNSGLRTGAANNPTQALCQASIPAGGYACSVTLSVPDLKNAAEDSVSVPNREMYLQLAAIYDSTGFKVELLNSSDEVVPFSGGQATVDSTGRAANLFRRVSARVSVNPAPLKYPEAALSTKGSLCKNFFVTNDAGDYTSAACDP